MRSVLVATLPKKGGHILELWSVDNCQLLIGTIYLTNPADSLRMGTVANAALRLSLGFILRLLGRLHGQEFVQSLPERQRSKGVSLLVGTGLLAGGCGHE